jgi:hypothetical protein
MPHTLGHHRSRSGSYLSGFTRFTASFQGRKAASTEGLNEAQLDTRRRAQSFRDLSKHSLLREGFEACKVRIEEELELQVQTLLRQKKYKEVTVPTSIKFSISREVPQHPLLADMARPRSPTGNKAPDTHCLDQTLLDIRQKLVSCRQ